MTVDFTSIPVIDLGKAEDAATRPRVLEELQHVLLNVGFLYVRNHGVSEEVIQDLVTALPVLFNLDVRDKKEVALSNSPHFLGHSGTGSETTAGKTDGREQFEFATELTDDWAEGQPLAERLKGPNQARCSTSIIRSQILY
jgi:isopenicillin N synthase-like dioxygenase